MTDPKYRRVVISRPSYDSKTTITVYYADGDVKKKEISSVALNTIEAFIGKIEDAEDKEGKDKEHLVQEEIQNRFSGPSGNKEQNSAIDQFSC